MNGDKCAICGGDWADRYESKTYETGAMARWTHSDPDTCVVFLSARAEAAEAERDALRAQVDGWRPVMDGMPPEGDDYEIKLQATCKVQWGRMVFLALAGTFIPPEYIIGWRPAPPQEAAQEA